MKFVKIEPVHSGEFLHTYNIHYEEKDGTRKVYEMVSRDGAIRSLQDLTDHRPDAVVAVITDTEDEHILLLREFRLEQGESIYGLPGGLIEGGESPVDCLARELLEETGLRLTSVTEVFPARTPACFQDSVRRWSFCLIDRAFVDGMSG